MIAALPMYDWPERHRQVDALWHQLRPALNDRGLEAPTELTRNRSLNELWLSADLLLGETCWHPLQTALAGRVRYVATPVRHAPGAEGSRYRSAIIARHGAPVAAPISEHAVLPASLPGRMAANSPDSLSGYVALQRDLTNAGRHALIDSDILWTGSHRDSIKAVATGAADFACIDCVSYDWLRPHEISVADTTVIGWTASRPGLPWITAKSTDDETLAQLRGAILETLPARIEEPAGPL